MSNAYYGADTSARTRTQLAHIRKKNQKDAETKGAVFSLGQSAWKAYQGHRNLQLEGMLSHTDDAGKAIYRMDPNKMGGIGSGGIWNQYFGDQSKFLSHTKAGESYFNPSLTNAPESIRTASSPESAKEGLRLLTKERQATDLLKSGTTEVTKEVGKEVGEEVVKEAGEEVAGEASKGLLGRATLGNLMTGVTGVMDLHSILKKGSTQQEKESGVASLVGTGIGAFVGMPGVGGAVGKGLYSLLA